MPRVLLASLLATLALGAVWSSGAAAVTWHNSGDTSFTATGGVLLFGNGSVQFACFSSVMTGTTGTSGFVGPTWTAAQGTITYPTCTLAGQNYQVWCTYAFTANGQAGGSVTSGAMDATCSYGRQSPPLEVCHIRGTVPVTYTNPTATTTGFLTASATSSLRTTDGAGAPGSTSPVTCPFGNDVAMTWNEQTFRITSATGGPLPHRGPVITRTA